MKFHDLAIGQRFELDGANYVKTSPVLASPEIGGTTKFMARYIAVRPLDGEQRSPKAEDKCLLPATRVREAFDVYHAACRQALAALGGEVSPARLEEAFASQEAARKDFLAALDR